MNLGIDATMLLGDGVVFALVILAGFSRRFAGFFNCIGVAVCIGAVLAHATGHWPS